MSAREVIFLGTASQVPTRKRNHHALFLRWDQYGILFDPGEGTQRQMAHVGLAATQITHIVITHFHGDHCLGLAALIQRISLDRVPHPIEIIYPASGQAYFERLRYASIYHDNTHLVPKPFTSDAKVVSTLKGAVLLAQPLDHRVDCFGYRLQEFDGRRMLPERLEAYGITGPLIGELIRQGHIEWQGKTVRVEDVSVNRRGQVFSLVMDTRPCAGASQLAEGADLLVCESTYLQTEVQEAHDHYHMTALQAATLAQQAGVRKLALTHFSQRYLSTKPFLEEARTVFPDVFVAKDLTFLSVPPRLEE